MILNASFPGPNGESISVQMGVSYQNGQPRVQLWDNEGPVGTLSVASAHHADLAPGEFLAKVWSENEEIATCALKSGLFTDTGRRVPMGHVEAQVWRISQ